MRGAFFVGLRIDKPHADFLLSEPPEPRPLPWQHFVANV